MPRRNKAASLRSRLGRGRPTFPEALASQSPVLANCDGASSNACREVQEFLDPGELAQAHLLEGQEHVKRPVDAAEAPCPPQSFTANAVIDQAASWSELKAGVTSFGRPCLRP